MSEFDHLIMSDHYGFARYKQSPKEMDFHTLTFIPRGREWLTRHKGRAIIK